MGNRFEIVKKERHDTVYDVMVLRDKLTGVLYLSFDGGLTVLLDKDGKPLTEWKD